MTIFSRSALALLALPLGLALASCNSSETDAATTAGEAIPPIAAPEGTSWVDVAVETPEGGFRIGNPDAPLKLVEYASHTCSHCAAFSQEANAPLEQRYVNSGVVSYELRNQIHDVLDLTIAVLARCSGPEAFHPLANQVWANFEPIIQGAQTNGAAINAALQLPDNQRYIGVANAAGLTEFFAARGVSRDQAAQCLAKSEVAQQVADRSDTQSKELDVTGTPTFFLNGSKIDGAAWSVIEPALQNAGAR